MNVDSPLGKSSEYPREYAPDVLHAIPREGDRSAVPGVDIWNAWEVSWLGMEGQPACAVAEIRVPADSPNIVESKSLKLYLGSLAMTRFGHVSEPLGAIRHDVGACTGAPVEVRFTPAGGELRSVDLPGRPLDELAVECSDFRPNPGLLDAAGETVTESLHSHSLRSLCPVTAQPDIGSILVSYEGPQIDPASLLRYIVSYREHNDFHEACVERMFLDIKERCRTQR